jgi:hypothetical protein
VLRSKMVSQHGQQRSLRGLCHFPSSATVVWVQLRRWHHAWWHGATWNNGIDGSIGWFIHVLVFGWTGLWEWRVIFQSACVSSSEKLATERKVCLIFFVSVLDAGRVQMSTQTFAGIRPICRRNGPRTTVPIQAWFVPLRRRRSIHVVCCLLVAVAL